VLRKLFIAGLFATLVAAPRAAAQPKPLMPGVTYDRQVLLTLHGPVVVHVLTVPKPSGLWSLKPVLSNDVIPGKEMLTALEQRAAAAGAGVLAGVNGDFSAADGRPTGIVMRGGSLDHDPRSDRSSIGIDSSGSLRVQRVTLLATWQGSGQRRPFAAVNDSPGTNGVALYTPAWGATTPSAPGSVEAVLDPFPPAAPNREIAGPVTSLSTAGGGTAIPPGGAVLVARGPAAQRLTAEAPVGRQVKIRLILRPDWSDVTDALGGGPLIVRNGVGVFNAGEVFLTNQLVPRQARSAVGQLRDGRFVLVTVDGGTPGYSTGLTNFELAQTLVRLGAVTAAALEGGEASAMAFDGQLLSRPSGRGGEAPVTEGLLATYEGVYAPLPTESVLSPNGDGAAEQVTLAYRVPRQSTVTATLMGPNGAIAFSFSGSVAPGTYPFAWNGKLADGAPAPEGSWRWSVSSTDDLGRQSTTDRTVSLDNTLGFPKTVGPALAVPRKTARSVATFNLARASDVTVRIETQGGALVQTLPKARAEPGTFSVDWDGISASKGVVYSGRYVARVVAQNEVGTSSLAAPFSVRRV
jgi:flagellar hook assembly protein FlgD